MDEYNYKNEEGKTIKVPNERWCWGVVYKDGTELKQFDRKTRQFHRFGEINQSEVAMFVMHKYDMSKRIDVAVKKGMQIFHFYRNFGFDFGTPEFREERAYAFGWKHKGAKAYHFILPDDRIVMGVADLDLQEYDI